MGLGSTWFVVCPSLPMREASHIMVAPWLVKMCKTCCRVLGGNIPVGAFYAFLLGLNKKIVVFQVPRPTVRLGPRL